MAQMLDERDVEEMERLAKRLLALCAKTREPVDGATQNAVRSPRLPPERQAELVAQMRNRLRRRGVR